MRNIDGHFYSRIIQSSSTNFATCCDAISHFADYEEDLKRFYYFQGFLRTLTYKRSAIGRMLEGMLMLFKDYERLLALRFLEKSSFRDQSQLRSVRYVTVADARQ